MGMKDRMFSLGRDTKEVKEEERKADIAVALTSTGKQQAETLNADQPRLVILSLLQEEGILTVRQLADRSNTSIPRVKELLNGLHRAGFVKIVQA